MIKNVVINQKQGSSKKRLLSSFLALILSVVLILTINAGAFFLPAPKVEAFGLDTVIEMAGLTTALGVIIVAYGLGVATEAQKDASIAKLKTAFLSQFPNPFDSITFKVIWCAEKMCFELQMRLTQEMIEWCQNWINSTYNVGVNEVVLPNIDFHDLPYVEMSTYDAVTNHGDSTRFLLPYGEAGYYFSDGSSGAAYMTCVLTKPVPPILPRYSCGTASWARATQITLFWSGSTKFAVAPLGGYTQIYVSASNSKIYYGDVVVKDILGTGEMGVIDNAALTWECPNTLWIPLCEGIPTDAGIVIGGKTFVIDDVATDVVGQTGADTRERVGVTDTGIEVPWTDIGEIEGVPIAQAYPIPEAVPIDTVGKWASLKPVLLEVFPFCLPWDYLAIINLFQASSKVPDMTIKWFAGQPFETNVHWSLADYGDMADTIHQISYAVCYISFAYFIIMISRKFIGGGG